MNKPLLKCEHGLWTCEGDGEFATGRTADEAYDRWAMYRAFKPNTLVPVPAEMRPHPGSITMLPLAPSWWRRFFAL